MNDDNNITAIIPVRLGSTRCKHKNIRSIGDTSLLKKKLDLLNQVPYIKYIIVSTSDEIVTDIINEYNKLNNSNIQIHLRDPYYSQTHTTGTELFKCLSESIKTQHMMYVTCVTPFVTKNDYINAICLYKKYQITKEYDSIVSCGNIKDFLWKDNKSLNYDSFNAQPSQLLPDIYNLTFAFNILSTEFVRNNHSIIGLKPCFYELDQISAIDIDTEYDFLITELLYKNGFRTIDDISKYLSVSECINKKIYLLDCTIRDGGFLNNWKYSLENVISYYKIISNCGIDFFECGFICNDFNKDYGDWWSVTPNLIQKLKMSIDNGSKIATMILIENITKLTIKIKDLDMIRILINLKKQKFQKKLFQI